MSELRAIAFKNCRNQNLIGVLHRAAGDLPRPCIIVCHGFAETKMGDRSRFLVDFSQHAVKHGISVFRFDFAGCGDSEGEFFDLTLESELEDLQAAVNLVATLEEIDPDRINIFAQCLGAVTAIRAGHRDQRIRKAVVWAPFVDLSDALLNFVGEEAFEIMQQEEEAGFIYRGQLFQCGWRILKETSGLDMFDEMERFQKPLLVMHGAEDTIVPIQQVEKLIDSARGSSEKKHLAVVKGAHHPFPYYRDDLFDLAVKWFV